MRVDERDGATRRGSAFPIEISRSPCEPYTHTHTHTHVWLRLLCDQLRSWVDQLLENIRVYAPHAFLSQRVRFGEFQPVKRTRLRLMLLYKCPRAIGNRRGPSLASRYRNNDDVVITTIESRQRADKTAWEGERKTEYAINLRLIRRVFLTHAWYKVDRFSFSLSFTQVPPLEPYSGKHQLIVTLSSML